MSLLDKQFLLRDIEMSLGYFVPANDVQRIMKETYAILERYDINLLPEDGPDKDSEDLLRYFLEAKRTEGRSELTLARYAYVLSKAQEAIGVPMSKTTVYHIRSYLNAERERGLADSTINGKREVINSFYRWLKREDLIEKDPTTNIAPIIEDNPKLKALYDNQVAYLNIKPNKENASIDVGESKIRVLDQTLITNWFGETNQSFFIGLTYITKDPSGYLLSQDPLPVECAWCLVDKNGMVKDVVSKIVSASAYTLVGRQFECKVTVPIDKTDAIMLCYRKNASAEWVVASHTDKTSIQMSHQRPLSELVSLKYSNYDQALIIEKPAGVIVDMIRTDGTKAGNKYSFDGPSLDYENNKGGYSLSEKKYAIRGNRGETWTVTFHDLNDSFSVDITF